MLTNKKASAEVNVEQMGAMGARRRIRLVATDLDGTLLAPDGTVTARTLEAVRGLQREEILLCLATARRWTGAVPIAERLGLRGPLILYDGALVRDYPSGEVLLRDPLRHETAQAAVALLAARGVRPIVQYSTPAGELLLTGPAPDGDDGSARYLAQFAAHVEVVAPAELSGGLARRGEVLRVVAFGGQRQLSRIDKELAHLSCGRQLLKATTYAAAELTLFCATASKGSALVALADRLGLALAETLAIGDGVNDIALLKVAGTSVAMGNAPSSVRRAARHLTLSNAEDGCAAALEAHALRVAAR